ncbi:MAG: hypothetical protein PVI56_06205 [Gammaproteobacteria bacterium]
MRTYSVWIVVALLMAGCAQQPTRQTESKKTAPQAFIDRSVIYYPLSGDTFEFAREYTYPNVSSGMQLTYRAAELPDARIDIFVYPIGDVPQDQALARDLNDVRSGVDGMVKRGRYADVKYGDLTEFNVSLKNGSALHGKRLLLAFGLDGSPKTSAAYLAYKQLYLLEMRITVPADSGDMLENVGDRIASETFRKIHILNEGTCALQGMPIGGDAAQVRQAFTSWIMHAVEISCVTELKPENFQPGKNEGVQILEFQPENWR